ncbi:leucyl aminopeptidase [Kushneria phosphatilytica]|uniref:Probable cytosol aminopeptidase n=1 Tax=Kushneria phosphatilytica TaxID=657387 RepID=A0A1S1NS34_9GAMM|nr:leucyl aminopeptidase [Kushneria phosphatilytica]OHV07730.1 leucyl aminopeptidase [Kushneria phosphatilytica]QEL10232.1 leucyl aminopeptidase [Kushneria phosphatilytica]
MEFSVLTVNPARAEADCIVVPVIKGSHLPPAAARLDDASERLIGQLIERGDFTGDLGATQLVPFAPGLNTARLLLVGFGEQEKLNEARFRTALDAAMSALLKLPIEEAAIAFTDTELGPRGIDWKARMIAESARRAAYRFDECKSQRSEPIALRQLALLVSDPSEADQAETGVHIGAAIGNGINVARRLGDLPGNICTPSYLATQAEAMGRSGDLTVTVHDEQALEEMGAGALLAVGRGSAEPSRLIVMEYRGADDPDEAPHVLIGKGISFDSGGISIKAGADMDEMKYDMGGAAGVFGTMSALMEMKPKLNVIGIVASAENMPDGQAMRPGDIVTTLKGLTVEVLNTDAEGRLALCDALAYADRYQPASVVDIATLTGACVIALGSHAIGMMSNEDTMAERITEAGTTAWDRAWRLPLWDEYQSQLDSAFADMANIGGRKAGAITAGCFLSRFVGEWPWAHLDIAGTAWNGKKGATGRPVGLLSQYLLDCAERQSGE